MRSDFTNIEGRTDSCRLDKRVRQLLETYAAHDIRFMHRKLRMSTQRSIYLRC
jgi:hypothetical protein